CHVRRKAERPELPATLLGGARRVRHGRGGAGIRPEAIADQRSDDALLPTADCLPYGRAGRRGGAAAVAASAPRAVVAGGVHLGGGGERLHSAAGAMGAGKGM